MFHADRRCLWRVSFEVLVTAFAPLLVAEARAVPVGVNVQAVMLINSLHPYDLDGDGLRDIEFQFSDVGAWLDLSPSGNSIGPIDDHDIALPLSAGPVTVPHRWSSGGGWLDLWPVDTPAYFGFEFRGHHAWAYLQYDEWERITLYGMGYETEPNTPIAMGAVPEPGAFAIVAASVVCVSRLRGRRERAGPR